MGILKLGLNAISNIESIQPLPKFKNIIIDIPIDESITPVIQPYRRIPIPLEDKVDKKIEELVQLDIIEAVNNPCKWVSPMVPIVKRNGDIRICIDMRMANRAILRENHPLPTIDTILPKLKNAVFFSKLDIKNAFHQLEISEASRYITTFITRKGLYRYKRLMFGITCAPEKFQKVIENIILGCEGVAVFIDDVLIFGSDPEEHDMRLKKVMTKFHEFNIMLNNGKCLYRKRKVEFLGHVLSSEGVRPLECYITSIKQLREPKTIEEIQSFLGLLNYIGKWIPNLATLTEPFRKLLRLKLNGKVNINEYWTIEQQSSFESLKMKLSDIKTLAFYDPMDRTQVIADASPVGLGAILIQFKRNCPRIIAYGNRSLTECEKRYCQTEKEALALVWAVEHFHIYLYGRESFELVTDHKPLETIFGARSKPCARIERWVLRLQAYNFKVIYKPGKSNIADPLSRLCVRSSPTDILDVEDYIHKITEYARPIAVSLKSIGMHSKNDPEILSVRKGVYEDQWDDTLTQYRVLANELCFNGDILLRGTRIVIPRKLREAVLDAAHEGHPGIVAMKYRLRTKVWWPKIDFDAQNRVRNCKGCTLVSAPNPPNPLKRREFPTEPWVDVALDFMGPLPKGEYLFVIVDYYSRYKEIHIMRQITAANTIMILKEIFSRLGNPLSITMDNGKQLTSQEMHGFCEERGIKIFHTVPYWPQANGEVERQNRDILKRLKISATLKSDWKEDLLDYLSMYNGTPHSTTGKTPADLFFRRQFRDKLPSALDYEHKVADEDARDQDQLKKFKGKEYIDLKRRAEKDNLNCGDKVYVKNMVKGDKLTANFNPTEHTIIGKKGADVQIRNNLTGEKSRRNVVHLKKVEGEWKVCPESAESESN